MSISEVKNVTSRHPLVSIVDNDGAPDSDRASVILVISYEVGCGP